MTCDEAVRIVTERWGGPLPAEALEHLAGCVSCESERRLADELFAEIVAAPVPDPGEDYWASFAGRVRRRRERVRLAEAPRGAPALSDRFPAPLPGASIVRPGPWLRLAVPAAAALVLITATLVLWQHAGPGSGPEGDLAMLESRLDTALLSASDEQIADLEEILRAETPAGMAADSPSDAAAVAALLGGDEALDAADDLAATFAGGASISWREWDGLDRLVDDLLAGGIEQDRVEELIRELDARAAGASPAGA